MAFADILYYCILRHSRMTSDKVSVSFNVDICSVIKALSDCYAHQKNQTAAWIKYDDPAFM